RPGRPQRPRAGRRRVRATLSSSSCTPACRQCRRAIDSAWSCNPMPRQIQAPMAATSSIRATCPRSITMTGHRQYVDAVRLRIVPAHVDVPEPGGIFATGIRLLVGRFGVLRQALIDQLQYRLLQAPGMHACLLQGRAGPADRQYHRGGGGEVVGRLADAVCIGDIGLEIQQRCAVEQVDTRYMQASGFYSVQAHHRLAQGIGSVSGAAGKDADALVTTQARRPHPDVLRATGGGMEHEQQPEMAYLFQPGDGRRAVTGGQQLQRAGGGRRQPGLEGNGELPGKPGTDNANGFEAVGHQGFRNGGIDSGLSSRTKWLPSGTSTICRFSAWWALSSIAALFSTLSRPGTSMAPRCT